MSARIRAKDVPPEVLRQLGLKRPSTSSSKTLAWKDVPDVYGKCKAHGMVWWPKEAGCVLCEYGDGERRGCECGSG